MNVKHNPLEGCPFCASIDTESNMNVMDEETLHWNMVCHSCDFEWIDVFEYVHSITTNGGEEELRLVEEEE